MKNTTIKDISKYTGFSTMTVSRVINDKVNRAIKKYGYEPNELARSLTSPPAITTAEYLVGLFAPEDLLSPRRRRLRCERACEGLSGRPR